MAWWNRRKKNIATSNVDNALTAAAMAVKSGRDSIAPKYDSWQRETWDYYDALGEFRYAIDWKAEMASRVRLRAGRLIPGQDEPAFEDVGPAAELISELGGGIGKQSEIMESLVTQINVPGEGYLVGETVDGIDRWTVRSNDEIRLNRGTQRYEVIDEVRSMASAGGIKWRELGSESLVARVWRPHKRYRYLADSPARAMRPTMRELELVNRKIQAQYMSRLASAGVLLMPNEVSFPVRQEFQEDEDPFVREWIETAREAIQNPGTASAVVPIPMRVPAEYIDKFEFIDFSIKDDSDLIARRESAIRRLATQVDVPAEILLGMGDVNHWSAWQLEEQAIKTHISSDVEIIVNALTLGYLHPMLKARGEDPSDLVVWYDMSELVARPDKSDKAVQAYDRFELSGKAFRRELGFDEDDAPSADEVRSMALRKLAGFVTTGFAALAELMDDPELLRLSPEYMRMLRETGEDEPQLGDDNSDDDAGGERSLPDTRDVPPPTPGADAATQARAFHRVEFTLDGWQLHHPTCCRHSTLSCPVAQASRSLGFHPGTPGSYETWLSPTGEMIIGRRTYEFGDTPVPGHKRVSDVATSLKSKAFANGSKALTNGTH